MRGFDRQTVFLKGLAALVAGLFAALGQVPMELVPLSLVGFAAGLWLVGSAENWRQATLWAWIFGFGHFLLTLQWITEPFQIEAERDAWMAPYAWVLLAVGLGLFWALAGGLTRLVPRGRACAFALTLVALEALRGVIFTGFPWVQIGHIWLNSPISQLASVLGAGGLILLTGAVAALLQNLRYGLAATVVLLGGLHLWGQGRLNSPVEGPEGPVVRIVQPNADQVLKWDPAYARMFFERHLDLSLAGGAVKPALVIWPETSVPFWLDEDGGGLGIMARAMGGTPVAFGIQRGEGARVYNSLAVLTADGQGAPQISAVYDKHHLVPFGEYIPLGDWAADWLGVFSFSPAEGFGYSAGPGPQVLQIEGLPLVQPLICYEAVFPYFQRAVERPQWLMQITNDAWFGDWAGPNQHLSLARLRSIESGLPLLRAANTGISAVVNARGQIVQSLGMGREGFIDQAIPAALPPTLYMKIGPWGAIVLWALGCLLFFRGSRVKD